MLLFWSMLVVVGVKIRGLYLSYAMFWLVFFLPPVLHYDLPKKALQKCLPLLGKQHILLSIFLKRFSFLIFCF